MLAGYTEGPDREIGKEKREALGETIPCTFKIKMRLCVVVDSISVLLKESVSCERYFI